MRLPPDFRRTLTEKSNQELIEMLVHQANYLPEALAAATDELRGRNVPLEDLRRGRALVADADAQLEREQAAAPGIGGRILSHFMGHIVWTIFLALLTAVGVILNGCLSF